MKTFWKIIVMSFLSIFIVPSNVLANQSQDLDPIDFSIVPELKPEEVTKINTKIDRIWSEWWQVWKHYTDEADQLTTSQQVASWIMNWDTIMNYLVFVVQFLSQLWLAVGVLFIMYAWYKYMSSVFNWWKLNNANDTVKNAIIWVIIVVFSYAILKTLTSLIGIS